MSFLHLIVLTLMQLNYIFGVYLEYYSKNVSVPASYIVQLTSSSSVDIHNAILINTDFNIEKPTLVYIPTGLNDSLSAAEIELVVQSYRELGKHNIFVLKGRVTNADQLNADDFVNCYTIGKQLADILVSLSADGYITGRFHIIGLGIGAVIGSIVGNEFARNNGNQLLSRLTAINPMFFYYLPIQLKRIEPSDAVHVEVIVTVNDISPKPSSNDLHSWHRGHVNFYLNPTLLNQPGCGLANDTHRCNIFRGLIYYMEAIKSKNNSFYAIRATDEGTFLAQSFPNKKIISMGKTFGTKLSGNFFLFTNHLAPYGSGPGAYNDYLKMYDIKDYIYMKKSNIKKQTTYNDDYVNVTHHEPKERVKTVRKMRSNVRNKRVKELMYKLI